jgi:cell division protein ZapA
MGGRQVCLRIGGQTYRVVSTASEDELLRLAAVVDGKLSGLTGPGRAATLQSMLLAALALAHDAEEERQRAESIRARAKDLCGKLLDRVDAALEPARTREATDGEPRPSPS